MSPQDTTAAPDALAKTLGPGDMIFLDRALLKLVADPTLSLEEAMRAVCEDDRRISTAIWSNKELRAAVVDELVGSVFKKCRAALIESKVAA